MRHNTFTITGSALLLILFMEPTAKFLMTGYNARVRRSANPSALTGCSTSITDQLPEFPAFL